MEPSAKRFLIAGAVGHFIVALLHYCIPSLGTSAYGYFGAPELMEMARTGSMVPAVATYLLAAVFTGCGVYSFSAAGIVRPLPFARMLLWIVGAVYVIRGSLFVLQIYVVFQGHIYLLRHASFSLAAFAIGLVQLAGLWKSRTAASSTIQ